MFPPMSPFGGGLQQTTSHKVVLPFYLYATFSFIVANILLLLNTDIVNQHHFYSGTMAIVHTMALGWGTMIIFGASHQLLPVLIEGKLNSNKLAYLTFYFSAIGIPFLIIGFYLFKFNWLLHLGGTLVNLGVIFYLINVFISAYKSSKHDVHSWFIVSSTLWLFSTTLFGLLLVFNFNRQFFPESSLEYLTLHAHLGLVGWFLLLVIGVGSRLIPMFLISKYTNNKTLWWIFALINLGLISFIILKVFHYNQTLYYIPITLILSAVTLFVYHCYKAYKVRFRKGVDEQMKISLLSVSQMLIPIIILLVILFILPSSNNTNISLIYGFSTFFGWITALILGMTFKTMPFIVWNKVYHKKAFKGKTPAPKELFNEKVFDVMGITYVVGFTLFIVGAVFRTDLIIKIGSLSLLISSLLYATNVGLTYFHKPLENSSATLSQPVKRPSTAPVVVTSVVPAPPKSNQQT